MREKLIVALLLALSVCCCAPPLQAVELVFGSAESVEDEAAALSRALDLYREGKTDEALPLLRGLALRGDEAPVSRGASIALARIFRERGQCAEAFSYLERIPEGERGAEAQMIEGACRLAAGEVRRGERLLLGVHEAELADADRILLARALADAKARLGQPLPALLFLQKAETLSAGEERDALLAQAHLLLREELDGAGLAEAAFMFRGTPIGQDARLQQAQRAAGRGDAETARRLAESLVLDPLPFPYRHDAIALWEQLSGETWLQRAVGVVLPLSGRYATFGALVRRGMDLALEQHRSAESDEVRFIYRDAGADPELSARAVSELMEGERVMAIAGPLTGSAAQRAAAQAQEQRIPLLALSQREGLPEIGDFVFRDSLTSRQQVQALVRYAMEERKMTRFAVLAPENRLGQEMLEHFVREVEKRGGEVVARQIYGEDATDFRRQIKLIKGEDPDAPEPEPAQPDEDIAQPPLPFEALFLPDYADRIGLLAPQLAFYGIEEIALLGINGWNSPDLVRLAGRFVEGAVFVDGFFRYSPYPFVQDFVDRYFEKYGEEPSILEAQGYDVAGILLFLLDRSEIRTREELRLALAQLRNYPGVTGATSFGLQGDAEKVLFLLQVQNGNIVQIN